MLTIWQAGAEGLEKVAWGDHSSDAGLWYDLDSPTAAEDRAVERIIGGDIPTRDEMQEIEFSSRLYAEDGALHMTASVLARADTDKPVLTPLSFVLAGERLVTVRYETPRAIDQFHARIAKSGRPPKSACEALIGLVEALVDRLADILETVSGAVDGLNSEIFLRRTQSVRTARRLETLVSEIGRQADLAAKSRESLVSLERLVVFANATLNERDLKSNRGRIKLLGRDIQSLEDHVDFLSGKLTFLLDATLGLISIEQNDVMRIMSVMATVVLPPTLIGTIYGMNFSWMPELQVWWSYPVTLAVMAVSGVAPWLYFRHRGWL